MIISSARKTFTHIATRYYTCATSYDNNSLDLLHLLQLSINHRSLQLTRQSHARTLSLGLNQNPFIATKLISAYATFRSPTNAKLVFDSVRHKSVFLWNSLINGYVKNYAHFDAFELFNLMCKKCTVVPDDFTLSTISKVCGELCNSNLGYSVHGKCIRIGFVGDTIVANSIMSMYCKCGEFKESRKVFDEMPHKNSCSWNVIIAGYAVSLGFSFDGNVWKLFRDMQIEGVKPDAFTVSSVLSLCGGGDTGKWDYGRELHCYIVKNGLELGFSSDVHLGCCLIDMYCKSNRVVLGRLVFDRMMYKNVFAWTAMINGYVNNGNSDEALIIFREMQVKDGIEPNKVSLVCVLPACSSLAGLMGGKQIHGFAIRNELNSEVALSNALIDMYSKCGNLNYAKQIFGDDSFCRDAISWSSMISGYGLHGKGPEAICLFNEMCRVGVKPDMITIVGVLFACGKSGLVNEGLAIYNVVINDYGINPTFEICACVVDMLGRSGRLDQALDFIKTMPVEPGPSVWGALVSASIIHGNTDMQDLAYRFLIQLEPENPSNYVSMSNVYASLKKWDVVAEVRTMMKERRLKKLPGCSWINISSKTHCFFVADKAHPCSSLIYEMLFDLTSTMKGDETNVVRNC